jgi:hypothetical protein
MAANFRTTFADSYDEKMAFIGFLSSFFITLPKYLVRSESVKIDVRRGSRKVATVVSDLTQRGSKIKKSVYSNKEFKPPTLALGTDFAPGDLTEKAFGKTEYETAQDEYVMQLMDLIMDDMTEIEKQFLRNIELQSAQIFQTGIMNLYDENGNIAYTIDFKVKATHLPTAAVDWDDPAANPDADIESLIDVIQTDSDTIIENVVFGAAALRNYLANVNVVKKFDTRRIDSGVFKPERRSADVRYLGDILIGSEYVACWKYLGRYEDPSTPEAATVLKYVDDDNVLLLPNSDGVNVDLRRYWCEVPRVTKNDAGYENILPAQLRLGDRQITPRIWENKAMDQLEIEVKARPISIPVSVDVFGCLKTIA